MMLTGFIDCFALFQANKITEKSIKPVYFWREAYNIAKNLYAFMIWKNNCLWNEKDPFKAGDIVITQKYH